MNLYRSIPKYKLAFNRWADGDNSMHLINTVHLWRLCRKSPGMGDSPENISRAKERRKRNIKISNLRRSINPNLNYYLIKGEYHES